MLSWSPGIGAFLFDSPFERLAAFKLARPQRLGLADRYARMSLDHLRDRHPALRRFFQKGGAARIASELGREAADQSALHGPNSWLAVLYRALEANRKFCNSGYEVLQSIQ